MRTTKVFDRTAAAYLGHPRYVFSCGGTRSGKTVSIVQLLYLVHLGEERRGDAPMLTSVVSESMPHLKRGAVRDFKAVLSAEGVWDASRWSETDKVYSFANGGVLEFFSVDNAGKVFGASRDRLFVNECQHIDLETFRQLAVRTRGTIFADYNPTHEFWAQEIESRPNCVRIHSTYLDNDFLTPEQVAEIESYRGDGNWWRVFGLGEVGTLEGLVYRFSTVKTMPETDASLQELQGLDFGFSADPTARVRVLADPRRKIAYVQERCYRTMMLNRDIAADLKADGVSRRVPVYADCAEPKSIAEIREAGFNVLACDKDAPVRSDKLAFQLQWMQGWDLRVTDDSLNLIRELRNYTWAEDKSGQRLPYPIDKFNHALDALRYALWSRFGANAGKGRYSISAAAGKKIMPI